MVRLCVGANAHVNLVIDRSRSIMAGWMDGWIGTLIGQLVYDVAEGIELL